MSYDLTQLSFQGPGPDLEGSVQAWQKRRSSDDAGKNSCPHFLSLTPLSEAPPDVPLPFLPFPLSPSPPRAPGPGAWKPPPPPQSTKPSFSAMRRAEATWHIGMERLFSGSDTEGPGCAQRTRTHSPLLGNLQPGWGSEEVTTVNMFTDIYKATCKRKLTSPSKARSYKTSSVCQPGLADRNNTLWVVPRNSGGQVPPLATISRVALL